MTYLLNPPVTGNVLAWQDLSGTVISSDVSSSAGRLEQLTPVFQKHGYHVTSLASEKAVLQAVLDDVPDLLLIYLRTSGSAGYDFCKILRSLPRSRTLPIVFVGTRESELELVKVLRCGGTEYMQMPMQAEEAWLRLERHLHTVALMKSLEAEKASLHQKIWSYNTILRQQEEIQISLAKENQVLQRLAFVDGLTQVANRQNFNKALPRLWKEAAEERQPLSLLLCDIDYFKRYNDTYGHPAGDTCLQAVADALVRAAHREDDQVSRYGGEEFAILLPNTDAKGAQRVALAAHSELARARIPHEGSLVKPCVSVSVGICTLTPDDAHQLPDILVHGADEALYTAKLRGRDRSVANTAEGLMSITSTACTYSGPDEVSRSRPTKLVVNTSVANDPAADTAVEDEPIPMAVGR